jgi:hypothetical protein
MEKEGKGKGISDLIKWFLIVISIRVIVVGQALLHCFLVFLAGCEQVTLPWILQSHVIDKDKGLRTGSQRSFVT